MIFFVMERDVFHLSDFAKILLLVAVLTTAGATHVYDTWGVFRVEELTAVEMTEALRWLDDFYKAPDGLRRPDGILTDGAIDYDSISNWLFRNYLQARFLGATPLAARDAVRKAIQATPEWQEKHR